jgi:hypothetical protein
MNNTDTIFSLSDYRKKLGFRVLWSGDSTDEDSIKRCWDAECTLALAKI